MKNLPHIRLLVPAYLFFLFFFLSPVVAQDYGIIREVFMGIPGKNVSDLVNHESFPDNPTSTNIVTDYFESPTDIADDYGQRMHGFIMPPETGEYVFWLATDDRGELHLSTDESPDNTRLIASVHTWAWPREWTREPTQRSEPIFLQQGKAYYISALMKEDYGGDSLAVRWRIPGGPIEEPIPAIRLLPFGTVLNPPEIIAHPQSTRAGEGDRVTFTVDVSNTGPIQYQWQRNQEDIEGAIASSYTIRSTGGDNDGDRFRVFLSNTLGETFSKEALLSIDADYGTWVGRAFPPEAHDRDEISGPDADPDGDGIPNLLEYALNGDPLSSDQSSLPKTGIKEGHLTLTFRRDPSRTEIAYIVEASSSLTGWPEIIYDSRVDSGPNNQREFMVVSDSRPLSEFTEKLRFLRLRVILID